MRTKTQIALARLGACREAREWAGARTIHEIWRDCQRGDWMAFLASRVRANPAAIRDVLDFLAANLCCITAEIPAALHALPAREREDYLAAAANKLRVSIPADEIAVRLRFWSRVEVRGPGECWPWRARADKYGRGRFDVTSRRPSIASRVAWELTNGPLPPGSYALHTCDVPACCNPDHIRPGTQRENIADAKSKNRLAIGANHSQSKLTEAQVATIRQRAATGCGNEALGREFGVTRATIWAILNNKTWRMV